MMHDVLVVGAGPVGLTMAAELARFGVSVRIIDKSAARTDKSKALVVWSRTLELLDRAGCAQAFVNAGMNVNAANIIAGTNQVAHVTFDQVKSPYAFALMIPQSQTERLLEEHLLALGVKVERQVELKQFVSSEDAVTATLGHPAGPEETCDFKWMIGCDGAHSLVRHSLGMTFEGSTQPSDWMLADLHLAGPNIKPDELNLYWHAEGALAIFPISPGRYRVIADVGDAAGKTARPDPTLAEVQAMLDRRGPGNLVTSDPIWLASFRINERKVASYRSGRIFLAGDAAHIHSPAGGQGMNTGMQDAFNLSWKLALVSRGIAREQPLLESYSTERSAVGRQVLSDAGRLTTLAIMKSGVAQAIRNHVASLAFGLSAVRGVLANKLTELSIGYPESPLTVAGKHGQSPPAPGQRAPIAETANPVGAGTTPRFALFAASDSTASSLLQRYRDIIEPALRTPFAPGGIWLVRPDGYVALVARDGQWDEVEQYLKRLTLPA